ncbi:FHA domain-containing protein [Paraburkholderia sp.]|uniref:FHA domain-containing protein n=1 Tax=Paraburkholderia sp. TaxID=1926495 RepID=UPI00239EDE7B|nr:FHA domain-containing protein [Paraburkholderia sp.]MDE1184503.1 FHA domain-containing protein [Paraburkholderia sp.]
MTDDASIVVIDGVHTGASVPLVAGKPLRIGSGSDADLMVIDDGVEALHVTVELQRDALALLAHHPNVTVFGQRVTPQRRTLLARGATFSLGAVTFQFRGGDPFAASSAALARDAGRAYLLRHAPLAYLTRRWRDAPRVSKAVVLAAPLVCGLIACIASMWSHPAPSAAPRDDRFRFVATHPDVKSGAIVYDGYVQSGADLSALTASAWSRHRAPVMRVIVLTQLHDQVGEFLARYYRGVALRDGEPGVFIAHLPDASGFVSAESWDYARVTRLARAEIDGLRRLDFPGHAQDGERVRVPLDALGLNLLASRHATWLTDAQGVRYFTGARLPVGRIARLSRCAADVVRDDGSIYEFFLDAADAPRTCP